MNIIDKLTNIEFWLALLEQFKALGPLAPILLTMIEALIPALPLVAIVTFNVAVYGSVLGFVYSWIGTTLGSFVVFAISRYLLKKSLYPHMMKHKNIKKVLDWISRTNHVSLFLLTCVAFTPSSLINISYGLSDFSAKSFYSTLLVSKIVMIFVLATFGNSLSKALENPLYLVLALGIILLLFYATTKIKRHTKFDEVEKD